MAFSINQIILVGKLGRDAETKVIGSGVEVTKFSVATDHRVKKGDDWTSETTWHNVVLWRNPKTAAELKKGCVVTVRGRQEHRQFEKDGVKRTASEVVAEDVIVHSGGRSNGFAETSTGKASGDGFDGTVGDDDIPF